jgi:hypothetical protein
LNAGKITANCIADGLRGPLIGRDKGAAVYLSRWQRIDPSLEPVDDMADGQCWLAGGAIMHGRQSSFR